MTTQECRVELVQDLQPGDYLPDYHATVTDIEFVTDPYPEPQHASVRLSSGHDVWLRSLDDILVAGAAKYAA